MGRKIIYFTLALLVCYTLSIVSAQGQPPAPPSGHGFNGNQGAGGAAPVDGGSLLLLLGAAGYGLIKVVRERKGGKG